MADANHPGARRALGIRVYARILMIVCSRFDHYDHRKRLLAVLFLVFVTLVVESAFVGVFFFLASGRAYSTHSVPTFVVGSVGQMILMSMAFLLFESIRTNGALRRRVESFVEFNPLGMALMDDQRRYVLVNPAFESMTGYQAAELIGTPWHVIAFGQACDEAAWGCVQRRHVLRDMPFAIRHKDGHEVNVRYTGVPMMEDENVVGYFSMVVDRSEVEQAEAALLRSERLAELGQLAAGIVHDVRNPLTAIMGSLDLLPTASDPQELLLIARHELTHIDGLLSELLVLGQPARGERTTRDLRDHVQAVVRLLAIEAATQRVDLATDMPDALVGVACDANRVKQALTNVVKNAVEAAGPGGAVKVMVGYASDRQVRITVQDNGHGMAPAVVQRLGEPFFTTKASGTGLGWMMTKNIIDAQGGQLDIQSAPGQGTTVTILLSSLPVRV